jgi:hypothetical protein
LLAALPAALWFAFIMVLLSLPGKSFPVVDIWQPDKIAHILLFGGQAVLLWYALVLPSPLSPLRLPPLLFSGIATVLFGIASEGYQHAFTTRMADPYDMIANASGVALFLLLARLIGAHRLLAPARRLLGLQNPPLPPPNK